MSSFGSSTHSLDDLFIHGLKTICHAERQIAETLATRAWTGRLRSYTGQDLWLKRPLRIESCRRSRKHALTSQRKCKSGNHKHRRGARRW